MAPGRVESLVALSNIARTNGNDDEAMRYAIQATTLAPNDPESLWTLALLYTKKKDLDHAAPVGLKSVKNGLTLVNSETLYWIIDYYAAKKDTQTLVYLYEKSMQD